MKAGPDGDATPAYHGPQPFPESEFTPPPGYELHEKLGGGSFGSVWRAVRTLNGLEFAIKFLHPRENNKFSQRDNSLFRKEFERLKELSTDRAILEVVDGDLTADHPYIVTRLYKKGSLETRCALDPKIATLNQRVGWIESVAKALQTAHRHQVVHCDLKPSNVLLDDDGNIKLADFGQASTLKDAQGKWGSLGFMAPEQATPEDAMSKPSTSWDLYALGALAYKLLTDEKPRFTGDQLAPIQSIGPTSKRVEQYRLALEENTLIPPSAFNPLVDDELESIILSCLELDPAARPPNVDQVVEDIQRWRTGKPLLCRKPWSLSYRVRTAWRLPQVKVGFALSLLAVMLVLGFSKGIDQKNFELLVQQGEKALNLGERTKAHLLWAKALTEKPDDISLRGRLVDYPFQLKAITRTRSRVTAVALSADFEQRMLQEEIPEYFAAGDDSGGIFVWAAQDSRSVFSAKMEQPIQELGFSYGKLWARTGSRFSVWQVANRDLLAEVDSSAAELSKDGRFILHRREGESVAVTPLKGAAVPEILGGRDFRKLEIGRGGNWAAGQTDDGVYLFNLTRGEEKRVADRSATLLSLTTVDNGLSPRVVFFAPKTGLRKWDEHSEVPFAADLSTISQPHQLEVNPWDEDSLLWSQRQDGADLLRVVCEDGVLAIPRSQDVDSLRFLGASQFLVEDGEGVSLHSASSGESVEMPPHWSAPTALDATDLGTLLVGAQDGTVKLWSTGGNSEDALAPVSVDGGVDLAAFRESGELYFTAASGEVFKYPNTQDDLWSARNTHIEAWALTEDSLVVGDRIGRVFVHREAGPGVLLWASESEEPVVALAHQEKAVLAITKTPRGSRILYWSQCGTPTEPSWTMEVNSEISACELSEEFAYFGFKTGRLIQLRRATGEQTNSAGFKEGISHLALLPQEALAVTTTQTLHFWPSMNPKTQSSPIGFLECAPGGTMIVTGTESGSAQLWLSAEEKAACPPLALGAPLTACGFSSDGKWVALGTSAGTISLWDTGSGKKLASDWQLDSPLKAIEVRETVLKYLTEDGFGEVSLEKASLSAEEIRRRTELNTGARLDEANSLVPLTFDQLKTLLGETKP